MTYLPGPKPCCQVNVAVTEDLCWNSETGAMAGSIVGAFPLDPQISGGPAYRAADDTFYIGGWTEGSSTASRASRMPTGERWSASDPADPNISGLAYNALFNVLLGGHEQ